MTDEVAIVTKAKENLLFAMASLDREIRIGLSYEKRELINMCSFNGKECDIDKLVYLYSSPIFIVIVILHININFHIHIRILYTLIFTFIVIIIIVFIITSTFSFLFILR